MQRAVLGELWRDAPPLHAGPDPHASGVDVDGDLLELADVDEERLIESAVRVGVVARCLRRHTQALGAGIVDGGDHVADVVGERHGGGPQVRREVEHLPRGVPVGIRGGHDASAHLGGESLEGGGGEHLVPPFIEHSVQRSAHANMNEHHVNQN